jgi:hypothetical protein
MTWVCLSQGTLREGTPVPPYEDGVVSEVIPVQQAGGTEPEQPVPVRMVTVIGV